MLTRARVSAANNMPLSGGKERRREIEHSCAHHDGIMAPSWVSVFRAEAYLGSFACHARATLAASRARLTPSVYHVMVVACRVRPAAKPTVRPNGPARRALKAASRKSGVRSEET